MDPQPPQPLRDADPVVGIAAPLKALKCEKVRRSRDAEIAPEPEDLGRATPREIDR